MKGDLRCIDGRLMRHDPQIDDPDLETDRGQCPECEGKGCSSETSEVIGGSVQNIVATVVCGGCGKHDKIEIDPNRHTSAALPSLFDVVIDDIRGGNDGWTFQGGYLLCHPCTRKVDDSVTEDRNATREEVERVMASLDGRP